MQISRAEAISHSEVRFLKLPPWAHKIMDDQYYISINRYLVSEHNRDNGFEFNKVFNIFRQNKGDGTLANR